MAMHRPGWGRKVAEWTRRYLPAEAIATCCALLGGLLAALGNPALAAFGGTWGENAGYYGTMLAREVRTRRALGDRSGAAVLRAVRDLALEFGGAELLDSGIIRPAAMLALIAITGSLPLGLILGKLAADFAFYGVAIGAYELRKRYLGA